LGEDGEGDVAVPSGVELRPSKCNVLAAAVARAAKAAEYAATIFTVRTGRAHRRGSRCGPPREQVSDWSICARHHC